MRIVRDDIPPVKSVFDLKSGASAKLFDRAGSMVIVEVEQYRLYKVATYHVRTTAMRSLAS
jgi:hypothetical protein